MTDGLAVPVDAALTAQPVSFGSAEAPLFGWFHPPLGARKDSAQPSADVRDCVVVMCNPQGYDLICAHRHYRLLAIQLAQSGFAVLRYDHHGTGDSSGRDRDPDRLQTWIAGVAAAIDEGRRRSGASRVALFGLRFGATLALRAARELPGIDAIVSWAAFAAGRVYLREMRAFHLMREKERHASPMQWDGLVGNEESAGFLFTAATVEALEQLQLSGTWTAAPPILLLERDDIPQNDKLVRTLLDQGCEVERMTVPGYAEMMRDTYNSIVPQATLDTITGWLSARFPASPRPAFLPAAIGEDHGRLHIPPVDSDSGVIETPLRFGERGSLFGILSGPAAPLGDCAGTAVIFLNVGSNYHIGPNRMYVIQARALARLGFTALRFDIGGVGESPADPGRPDNQLYAAYSVHDVQAAIGLLREHHGVRRILLFGVCSGAYLGFHTALSDERVDALVLVNPQTFDRQQGASLELAARRGIRSLRLYGRLLGSVRTWLRFVRGEIDLGYVLKGASSTLKRHVAARLPPSLRTLWLGPNAGLDVRQAFRRLLRRHVDVSLLYSGDDGGIDEMEVHLGFGAAAVRGEPGFHLDVIDGADHTFSPIWAQRELQQYLVAEVLRVHRSH